MSDKQPTVWDVYNDITVNKDGIGATVPNSVYVQFVLNRGLSYFPDTILDANVLNRLTRYGVDRSWHYLYATNTIEKKRRMTRWAKKSANNYTHLTDFVAEHMNLSKARASTLLSTATAERLKEIETLAEWYGKLDNGGSY